MADDHDCPPEGLITITKKPIPTDLAETLEEALAKNPQILKVVNKFIMRETLKSALFTAFFFIGMFSIISGVKTVLGGTYVFDIILGVTLSSIGIAWIIKNLKAEKGKN